jgi:hypothetical protein
LEGDEVLIEIWGWGIISHYSILGLSTSTSL